MGERNIDPILESKLQIERKELREKLGIFFDTYHSAEEKLNRLLANSKDFMDAGLISDREAFVSAITECSKIENKEEFIERMFNVIEPILVIKISNPRLIEEIQAKGFVEQGNFIVLNEALSYGVNDDYVHIHIAPASELMKEKGIKGSLELISDGLRKLAKIVSEDENIKKVTATSWIVAEHPRIMEFLGFSIIGPIDDDDRDGDFRGEKRKISSAEMLREDFLSKYPPV